MWHINQLMLAKRSQHNRPLTAFVTALRDSMELQSVVGSLTNRMYFSTMSLEAMQVARFSRV